MHETPSNLLLLITGFLRFSLPCAIRKSLTLYFSIKFYFSNEAWVTSCKITDLNGKPGNFIRLATMISRFELASITVIIPAYNAAAFLEETVLSAINQTCPPERIIVVDDGSPDNGHEIALQLAAKHPKVHAIQRRNGGAAAARNTGLFLSSTEFVLFLDADDRLLPEAISHHVAAFMADPNAAMVFGSNYTIDLIGARISENLETRQKVALDDLAMVVTPCPSQCLYRREALQKIGGLNEQLRYCEDIDLNMRLLKVGAISSFPDFVMEYRSHPGQATANIIKISDYHLKVLEINLGPSGLTPNPTLYRRARRKWLARYGHDQYMTALGAVRHGRWHQVLPAFQLAVASTFVRLLGAEWRPGGR
jgi:glycosyltransferase involved in cell wall biosynthesis